jgi:hypothetical protein
MPERPAAARRALLPIALLAAVWGCAHTPPPEGAEESRVWSDAGWQLLVANNPMRAKVNFERALKAWKENVEAKLGLAEASREYGNLRFQEALRRLESAKGSADEQDIEFAQRMAAPEFEAGLKLHHESAALFNSLIQAKPNREIHLKSVFGLGKLHYDRIGSPWSPYLLGALNDPAEAAKVQKSIQRDRDEAIRLFRLCLTETGGTGTIFTAKYLSTLLIARAAAGDLEEAERWLGQYEELQKDLRKKAMGMREAESRNKALLAIDAELQVVMEARDLIRLRREERR